MIVDVRLSSEDEDAIRKAAGGPIGPWVRDAALARSKLRVGFQRVFTANGEGRRITLRMSEEQAKCVKMAAERDGLPVATWIRCAAVEMARVAA